MVWKVIDCAPNYEISDTGIVRSRKTGKIKPTRPSKDGSNIVVLYNDNRRMEKRIAPLMFRLHGIPTKLKRASYVPVSVSLGDTRRDFDTITAAADFLASQVYYSDHYLRHKMHCREKEIFGWTINYPR